MLNIPRLRAIRSSSYDCNDRKQAPPLLFGTRLRHARLAKCMRQQALADLAGCSKSMLSKIEADRVVPSLPTLQRIAKALEITLANLLADPPEGEIVSRPGSRPVLNVDPMRRGEIGERLVQLRKPFCSRPIFTSSRPKPGAMPPSSIRERNSAWFWKGNSS
jgi:transcriptional regulator with XRE-family HTH domain